MPARRCSICAKNYRTHVAVCPACGEKTWWGQELEPDADEPVVSEPEADAPPAHSLDARLYDVGSHAKIVEWRAACFLRLGFDELRANALAVRRDIDREDVQRMVGKGATPEQVALIVL